MPSARVASVNSISRESRRAGELERERSHQRMIQIRLLANGQSGTVPRTKASQPDLQEFDVGGRGRQLQRIKARRHAVL